MMFDNSLPHKKIESDQSNDLGRLKRYLKRYPKSSIGLGAIALLLVIGTPIAQTRLVAQDTDTAEVNDVRLL